MNRILVAAPLAAMALVLALTAGCGRKSDLEPPAAEPAATQGSPAAERPASGGFILDPLIQ